jgi:hypothetical protein
VISHAEYDSERPNPKSQIRNVERVFFLGYFEERFLGRRLVESKTI